MKPVIPDIGRLAVHINDDVFIFNPSFLNMTKIGGPAEIVRIFSIIYGGNEQVSQNQIFDCVDDVLEACCDTDCAVITGYLKESEGNLVMVDGVIPVQDKIILAQHLLKHGLIGKPKTERKYRLQR